MTKRIVKGKQVGTLFGLPIIESEEMDRERIAMGEVVFGPLTKESARQYFEALAREREKEDDRESAAEEDEGP